MEFELYCLTSMVNYGSNHKILHFACKREYYAFWVIMRIVHALCTLFNPTNVSRMNSRFVIMRLIHFLAINCNEGMSHTV